MDLAQPEARLLYRYPNGGPCLEAKKLPGGRVALRQSADPASPALILEPDEIRAFIEGAKTGQADDLLN